MKKFLFTLAALLMAGSMLAGTNYFYVPTFDVTSDQVGTNIEVPCAAHFEDPMNSGTVFFTMPEGLVIRRIVIGSSLSSITIHDDWGDQWAASQTVFVANVQQSNFGWATADKDYYEVDGQWVEYGAVKLMPGEYNEMAVLTIRVTDAFKGGDITVRSELSCGEDARPNVEPGTFENCLHTDPVTFNGGGSQPEEFTATPSVTFAGNVATLSYTSNDADAVATVTVNGVETAVEWNNGTATYTVTEGTEVGTHNVVVVLTVAPGPDESHEGEAVSANATYTYTVKPNFVANPTITFDANGVATLSMNANDPNATAVVTVDGTEVNVAFENGVATLPLTLSTEVGDHAIVVAMTVSPSADYEGQPASATNTYNYTVNPEITPAPACNIQITETEEYAEITIENYTEYMITVNGAIVDQFPSRGLPYKVMRTYQDQAIKVTAKNDPNPALYTPATDSKELLLTAKANEASQPATLGTPYTDANNLYIPVNGNVQSILVDGAPYALNAAGELVLPRAEQPWTPEIVIVTNDSSTDPYIPCDDAPATFDDITVPAWVTVPAIDLVEGNSNGHWVDSYYDEQGNPVWGHMEYDEEGHCMNVTFSTTYEDAILYYQILDEDGNILAAYSGQTEDQSVTVTLNENGKYTAVAWVVLPNDESRRNVREFEIDDMTNVNELVNGKTVANVRYFNVAGQEMQEANGMTIVVTTYTDGTTSTVKVMK